MSEQASKKAKTGDSAKSKSPIPMRECSKGACKLPCVGVGCWSFGSNEGEYWGERKQADINDLCLAALEYGPALFDTAEAYQGGRSESSLATALKSNGDAAKQAIVVTKILPANCHDVRKHLEASLARLECESVYLYQVHWPLNKGSCGGNDPPSVTSVFEQLGTLQKEGKITHIGVSNFGVKQMTEALATGVTIATNQLCYNMLTRAIEFDVIPFCAKNSIGVIAYSPLLQGLLTDKGVKVDSFDDVDSYRTRTRHFSGKREKSRHEGEGHEHTLLTTMKAIKEIAEEAKESVSTLAMRWVLMNPCVVCVIPGARNRAQLEANMSAAQPLSAEIKAKLDQATDALKQAMGNKIDIYNSDKAQRCE